MFLIEANGKGGFSIRRNPDTKLDHSQKYKVELRSEFANGVSVKTKQKPISVVMGSAKLTAKTVDARLFANDKNDRVVVWLETKDATLNGIREIQIKDSAYKDIFEIFDYGNGIFAIGFKGEVPKSLSGKIITLNLNVYMDGNRTAKTNATVKVKVTLVK